MVVLQRWLGSDQVIDLKKWALCLGLRKAYLDTLPDRRWAGHAIVLDEQRHPQELLRLVLDNGQIYLRFLPPTALAVTGAPPGNLIDLAAQIAQTLPPDPPSMFTLVLDRQAINEMLIAILADPARARPFAARLAAGYGVHWAVHALTPIGRELIERVFRRDFWAWLGRWDKPAEGQVLLFHRDSAPATRRGVRQVNGQIELLDSADLINVPTNATWIDERFVGEGIDLLDRMLREPPQNVLELYGQILSFLSHNYVRRPGGKAIPWLRILPDLFKSLRQLFPETVPPPPPRPEKLTLALYFQFDTLCEQEQDLLTFEQRCATLFDILDRHPHAHVTLGWTETALHILSTYCIELEHRYLLGVQNGRFETVAVIDTPPLPMLVSRRLLSIQADNWEMTAARQAQLWARGVICLGGNLTPGWGESLRGHNYQYVAFDEASLRRTYPEFDPLRPIIVEGWPVIGFHRELSQVLTHLVDKATWLDYLAYLSASFPNQTLAARIDLQAMADLDWLEPFLQAVESGRFDLVFLSELAGAQPQGTAHATPDLNGLEIWTSSEVSRALNAASSALWNCCQDLAALADRVQADERERDLDLEIQKISLDVQRCCQERCIWAENREDDAVELSRVAGQVEQAFDQSRIILRDRLLRLGLASTLPERALGTLRIFEPLDLDRQSDLLTISLPLPESVSPQHVVFMDHGLILPSQWLGYDRQGLAEFLLVVDITAGGAKDLIVLREGIIPPLEGLDITPGRLCNPALAVLLDAQGQITSLRFQGQERLCGPGNLIRGHVLELDRSLRCDLTEADIRVASTGPLRGTVTIRQTLPGDVTLIRHLHLSLFSSLLTCETELDFPLPLTFAGKFIVGEFDLAGEQVIWPLPLQAGSAACEVTQAPPVIFSAEDTIELRKAWQGIRYMVHQPTSRTFQFSARPVVGGLRVGMIASMPGHVLNLKRLGAQPGLGFPGHTYHGHYRYRYALQPLSPDLDIQAMCYNRPLLWSFYPRPDVKE